jgi:hypothetical protein
MRAKKTVAIPPDAMGAYNKYRPSARGCMGEFIGMYEPLFYVYAPPSRGHDHLEVAHHLWQRRCVD